MLQKNCHRVINISIKESYIVNSYPPVILHGIDPLDFHVRQIEYIRVGQAELSIGSLNKRLLSERQTSYCVLAMLGFENDDIAEKMARSFHTVKDQVGRSCDRLNIDSRGGIARVLLKNGIVKIDRSGQSLGLTKAELPVVDGLTRGLSNSQIGSELGRSQYTAKSHIAKITRKTQWNSRQLIGLAAMVSGEIDFRNEPTTSVLRS